MHCFWIFLIYPKNGFHFFSHYVAPLESWSEFKKRLNVKKVSSKIEIFKQQAKTYNQDIHCIALNIMQLKQRKTLIICLLIRKSCCSLSENQVKSVPILDVVVGKGVPVQQWLPR